MARAAAEIAALRPDALLIYSTGWYAVLDQLWQGRARMSGVHVDENWHELGELRYDVATDVPLARACARAAQLAGIGSKLVDYPGFPLDSGTLSANALLNPEGPEGAIPTVMASNNLYHDFGRTRELGELAAAQAAAQGKRVVVVAVGGLSGSQFRDERALADDALASTADDDWNRRVLRLIEARDVEALLRQLPDYVSQARVEMGFKHLAFALGALGGRLGQAKVYGYGPQYGSGAAVIRLL